MLQRTASVYVAIALLLMMGCQADTTTHEPGPTSDREHVLGVLGTTTEKHAFDDSANLATLALLEKRVTLRNDNLALEQVIRFIRETTGANIAINWPALEIVGIDQDSLVTISLSNVTAGQLLEITLDQVSADAFDDDKAGFAVDDGVAKISTLRDLKSDTYTAVYNARWFIMRPHDAHLWLYENHPEAQALAELFYQRELDFELYDPPGFDLNDALSGTSSGGSSASGGGGGGPGGASLFADEDDDEQEEELEEVDLYQNRVDMLVELIHTTVGDPDEWLDEESTLTEINGNLIIRTTRENHLEIIDLLADLYHDNANRYKTFARTVEVYTLLREAETHRLNQDYQAAKKKVDQALRVDPRSLEARALREIISATLSR